MSYQNTSERFQKAYELAKGHPRVMADTLSGALILDLYQGNFFQKTPGLWAFCHGRDLNKLYDGDRNFLSSSIKVDDSYFGTKNLAAGLLKSGIPAVGSGDLSREFSKKWGRRIDQMWKEIDIFAERQSGGEWTRENVDEMLVELDKVGERLRVTEMLSELASVKKFKRVTF